MNESTFPYRVDELTRKFLADLVAILQNSNARFASHSSGVQIQFLDKGTESKTIDGPMAFTQTGLRLTLPMNAVAKTDTKAASWLRKYHDFISRQRNENFTPVPPACKVIVDAKVDGRLEYYLTYMVAHGDGSLAQDTPQGKLYATEALYSHAPASQPAKQAEQAKPAGPQEEAAWME